MATAVQKLLLDAWRTVLTTELNSLANNALTALGPAFDNTAGNAQDATHADGYPLCDIEFVWSAPGGTFAANTGLSLWFIGLGSDGSTYEYNAATPPGLAIVVPLPAVGTAGRKIIRNVPLPSGTFKVLAKDDGTGQSLGATGNTVSIRPKTLEMV